MNDEPKKKELAKQLADDLMWILREEDADGAVMRCEERILQTIEQVEREARRTLAAVLRAKVYTLLESEQNDHCLPVGVAADKSVGLKKITEQAARQLERSIILETLEANAWHRRLAARSLRISYRALLYKMKTMGLPQKRSRKSVCMGNSELLNAPPDL